MEPKLSLLKYQQAVDEACFFNFDARQQVKSHNQFPYNTIGKVISHFTTESNNGLKTETAFGTATRISKKVLLTSAHVIYDKKTKQFASHVEFCPFWQKKEKSTFMMIIPVESYHVHPKFVQEVLNPLNAYDMALLVLKEHHLLENQDSISPLKYDYRQPTQVQSNIMVVGYSDDKQALNFNHYEEKTNQLYQELRPPKQQDGTFLYYLHTTSSGNSGGPIFAMENQKPELIGIHKGTYRSANYGLLINQIPNTQQILTQIIEKSGLQKQLQGLYMPSRKELSKENNKLKDKVTQLSKTIDNLQQTIRKLKQQNESLKATQLNEKNESLSHQIFLNKINKGTFFVEDTDQIKQKDYTIQKKQKYEKKIQQEYQQSVQQQKSQHQEKFQGKNQQRKWYSLLLGR